MKRENRKIREMAQTAIFGAIIVIMAFTPMLGYIPLGFTRATIIHIPVILGALALGPKRGAALGFLFGLTSFLNNTINPTVTSFVFTPFYRVGEYSGGPASLLICFVPRILTGVVPWYVYRLLAGRALPESKSSKSGEALPEPKDIDSHDRGARHKSGKGRHAAAFFAAGVSGALTNTLLVMNLIYLCFRDAFAGVNKLEPGALYGFILTVIGVNGVPEAVLAGVLTLLTGRVLLTGAMRERLGINR